MLTCPMHTPGYLELKCPYHAENTSVAVALSGGEITRPLRRFGVLLRYLSTC